MVELVVNKRKFEAGEERLQHAKMMSTEAQALKDEAKYMNDPTHHVPGGQVAGEDDA